LAGAVCFVTMPGVMDLAHEAKPHLACAVATMAAAVCASRYLESGRRSWWIGAGVCCGLAWGLMLSGAIALVMLPVMGLMRRRRADGQTAWESIGPALGALAVACGVFAVSNPYLIIHMLWWASSSGGAVRSNLDNTAAMYAVSRPWMGLWNVVKLAVEGTSLSLAVLGTMGAALLVAGRRRGGCSDGALLLAGPALLTAAVFGAVGADKPAEFGRFLLDIDVMLLVTAMILIVRWVKYASVRGMLFGVLMAGTILTGGRYWLGFLQDSRGGTTRTQAAAALALLEQAGNRRVDLWAEPAPYCAPPMDLFQQDIVLLPRGTELGALPADTVGVSAVDRVAGGRVDDGFGRFEITGLGQSAVQTPISWAAKPFLVWAPMDRIKSAVSGQ
jgi:hypothetical protein